MMVSRALLLPKHHLIRLFRPDLDFAAISELRAVGWQRRRLLGTAAAREEPVTGRKTKRVSKEMRKAMVIEYVSKYRAMNGGKLPSASVIQKQVGGGYYNVRAILQELEFKLATMETKDENSIAAGRTDKVNGISPLSSKEVDETSEVGEALNSEVLVGRTKVQTSTTIVSTSYRISADNGTSCEGESSNITDERVIDKSIVPHCNETCIEHESSSQTAKVTGIYEVGEVLDSEVEVSTASASNAIEILVDGSRSSQVEASNDSGHEMVDTRTSNNYSEASAMAESSAVGRTDKTNEISEVREVLDSEVQVGTSSVANDVKFLVDGGTSSQGEVSNDSGQMKVDATIANNYIVVPAEHESSTVDQIAKTNGSSDVRDVLDSEKQVGTVIVSCDSGIVAADGSSSQGEGSNNSAQTMVDTTNVTNYNEVSAKDAKDDTWIVGQTEKADGISEEGSELLSKLGYYPSEVPGASRSTDLGKIDETSSKASESDPLTREKTQNEAQKTSVWSNLKSFASSIISIWRR